MLLLSSLILFQLWVSVESQAVDVQPYCTDFKPPFSSNNKSRLCFYRKYGCCTDGSDLILLEKYIEISRELRLRNMGRACNGMIVALLCENCSPFSGQLFNFGQSIPRVCSDSCESIYQRCSKQIRLAVALTTPNNSALLGAFDSMQTFCDSLVPVQGQSDLCFPESEDMALDIPTTMNVTDASCVCLEKFADNLRNPLTFRHAADGSRRVFIGEQIGLIHIYFDNGTRAARPFLDITSRVMLTNSSTDERGLLGLEFHPGYYTNDKFYVYYTTRGIMGNNVKRLSEFLRDIRDSNLADPTTERVLLEVPLLSTSQSGGELLFDADGYLLVFIGDGRNDGDSLHNAQNRQSMLGKVLRIDVNRPESDRNYGIPPDNPFINDDTTLSEIYAFGIRNIWRCGRDRGDRLTKEGEGRILCGDVGQNRSDELNLIQKGGNYGWPIKEGAECVDGPQCNIPEPEVLPLFAFERQGVTSITGGNFYRGCASPNLDGYFIYGDSVSGKLFTVKETTRGSWENKDLSLCPEAKCMNGLQGQKERYILSFGEDEQGEVYVMASDRPSSAIFEGKVYKIVDPMRRGNPDVCPQEPFRGPIPKAGRPTTQPEIVPGRPTNQPDRLFGRVK